jgi:hypothetical protein
MSASLKSRPNLRTAANRRGGRVEDGRGSLGHAATLRFPSPLIEPDHLRLTVNAEERRSLRPHRRHKQTAIQEQIPHLAARLCDEQAAMACHAVLSSIAKAALPPGTSCGGARATIASRTTARVAGRFFSSFTAVSTVRAGSMCRAAATTTAANARSNARGRNLIS